MIFAYNKQNVGDTLMVIVKNDENKENKTERKGAVARIQTVDGETVAWNFFNVSEYLTIQGNGQVELSENDIEVLNGQLKTAGYEERLVADLSPKFVVGYVKTCVDHPDSDHLHVTETEVDGGNTLQIVCGAVNIEAGQKVVVAKPGAMMPDGQIIWPGSLRGVESFGMICSAKELHLPNAPEKKGILVLAADAKTGEKFEVGK
ncbi:YtpR family tRNA-binding protein [Enterococcus sp. 22-H-5-01]|uniref:YtpR family tRNA-binding protein n=1 Tax=Enterococcus sp. 22-H-5-01 TaxID=3418555 RepID=UPI003D047BE1